MANPNGEALEIKKLRGTLRADRMPKNPVFPEIIEEMKPPTFLNSDGKKAFKSLVEMLGKNGYSIISNLDITALTMLCETFGSYLKAVKELKKKDNQEVIKVISPKTGIEKAIVNPWVKIKNDSFKNLLALLPQFGLTPSSRNKVGAIKKDEIDPNELRINDFF